MCNFLPDFSYPLRFPGDREKGILIGFRVPARGWNNPG